MINIVIFHAWHKADNLSPSSPLSFPNLHRAARQFHYEREKSHD